MKKEKKESSKRLGALAKRTALLLCAAMLLPMAAVGCQSAQDIIQQRERSQEVSRNAEQYMQDKYSRSFKVRKCEACEGDAYEGDFFISFNNGVHAFYDAEEDLFYDDRQADVINEYMIRDIWLPLFDSFGVQYENVNDSSQTFNMVYRYQRGGKDNKYSMYHEYFSTSVEYYGVHSNLSVTSENLILVADNTEKCPAIYDKIRTALASYFKAQKKGSLDIYMITSELAAKQSFKPELVDESTEGCLAHFHFSDERYYATPHFAKVTDGLYLNLCHKENYRFFEGDVALVPVEDYETVSKQIVENMDGKEIGLIDKYTAKKRNIDFENTLYKLEISPKVFKEDWESVTLAFMMKDSDAPIAEYAEMNEKEHSFFGYNMNGTEFNATCLCSPESRSVLFTFKPGDEVYFWFGTLS